MTAGDDPYIGHAKYRKDNAWMGKGPNTNTIPIKKVMKKYFKGKEGITVSYTHLTLPTMMSV